MDSVKSKIKSDSQLKQGIKILKENMKLLRDQILTIQGKLSLARETPYLSLEEREKLDKVYKDTTQSQNIPGKIEEVKGKLEDLIEIRANYTPSTPSKAFDIMSNEDKRRVISIMKEQTKGVSTLVKKTKENAYKLEAMEFIADNVKKEQQQQIYAIANDRYVY